MSGETGKETFVQQKVTYVLEQQGRVIIVWEQREPTRVVEAPFLSLYRLDAVTAVRT